MKSSQRKLPAIILSLIVLNAGAAVRYVDVNGANPASPYTNWATAATTIQQAIDVALAGDEILVTNGVYQTGTRTVNGMNNRVAVTKPVTVRSVNGPAVTQIKGYQVPLWTHGAAAVRCVYLTSGATLSGFTLMGGATQNSENRNGGGVWCQDLGAVVSNCVITSNSASLNGGGVSGGTLNNCTLTGNSASYGGGVSGATLNNCTLFGNSSHNGGGAYYGTLNNCVITGNSADRRGGGATSATLNNCRVTGNSAGQNGGGVSAGSSNTTLNNCTLTGNSAGLEGGGAYLATLNNCIVYYNTAPTGENYAESTLNFSCTTPLPAGGPQNLSDEPQLASMSYLSAGSPCIGRGSVTRASGVDMDGEPWATPPSIGCDEYWSGSVTGALSLAVVATYAYVPVGFDVSFQALIDGRVNASCWDFGDGSVVSNRPYASHAWKAVGDYPVELRAFNESYPTGIATTVTVRVLAPPVHYVSLTGTNPVTPYSSWATAATNIQDAIDAAAPGGLIWVSNGVYQTGGVWHGMSNRVAVTKAVTVRSVNGPSVTQIVGYKVPGTMNGSTAVRCVYLTNGAVLAGFTLTNGATQTSGDFVRNRSGGGILCEGTSAIVSNCVLVGNSAYSAGGGTYSGTLNNCTVIGNYAADGGGAFLATLNDSTIVGNFRADASK